MNRIALVVPFVLIVAAPFIGRWRANVWLRQHRQRTMAERESRQALAEQV
jgi:hypothetical protein